MKDKVIKAWDKVIMGRIGSWWMGEDMRGKSPTGGDYDFWGKKHFGGGHCIFGWGIFSSVGSLVLGVFVNHCTLHRVVGGFGHGGQDSLRYPGAREPDRLLLVGWVVSRFGQGLVKEAG
jgi:hypothetical protein